MDTYTTADAPLGPIQENVIWARQPASQVDGEGWVVWDLIYLDQMGREYTSVEHLAHCAIRTALSDS